ncbi:MAG: energy-coupling factor transporter transmembrane protein EcfT [Candidatus Wallbacteria bacterium]|nr:energy-coupling factor transporter transmembrane protein EcfT [Candidatus Wallbacteria bacterium]
MLDFLKDFSMGQYVPGESYIHHLDSRMKIVLVMIFIVNVFITSNLATMAALFLFVLLLVQLAGLRIVYFFRGIRAVFFLLIVVAGLNLFFISDGTTVFSCGILHITDRGIYQTALVTGRILLLVIATTLLTLTTSPVDLTYALEKILKPAALCGFPAHDFALMTTIALRFIPILSRELDKIIKAQIARGIDFRKGRIRARLGKISALLLPLFFNSFKRADELALAMEVRCYTGGEGRTSLREYRLTGKDFAALLLFLGLITASRMDLILRFMP